MSETILYPEIKRFLETQGYVVKSEVKNCDVVAVRGTEIPVIVELKQSLTLPLFYQAVDRLSISENVYVAIPRPKRGVSSNAVKLCRRIGIGLIIVTSSGSVEAVCDPVPYAPRINTKKRGVLLKEFNARAGDPNIGGSTRKPLMTAYRQDALKCAAHLNAQGPSRIRDVKAATKVDRAPAIFHDNVYGWFDKVERGVYQLSKAGQSALA